MANGLKPFKEPNTCECFLEARILQTSKEPLYPLEIETEGYKEVLASCEV